MRYIKIFLLHFEHIFEHRLRSFVWFLIPFANALPLILFWKGVSQNKAIGDGWTLAHITSYYIFLIIAGPLLMFHIEEDVAEFDIKKGDLVRYLLRPFPYFLIKFFEELPYRVLQGSYGMTIFLFLLFFFPKSITFLHNPLFVPFALVIAVFGLLISYVFKMCLGLLAFWFVENRGIYQLFEIVTVLFAGYIMPIALLPRWAQTFAYLTPFPYIIYFPIVSIQGKLVLWEMLQIIGTQCLWIIFFMIIYKLLWKAGIKEFTAVGQ